jgi:hypothetical protein
MKKKSTFIKCVVLVFPLIFLWAGLNFDRTNYPNDPEYIYLMNALCICDGQSVGHIDNPGTTLMQIGAATIAVKHVFSNPENDTIVTQALKNPDLYIESTRKVIVVLNTMLLVFMGWIGYRKSRSVWTALLLQVSMFLSAYILEITWAKLSPEPLLFFMTGLFVVLIFCYYHEKDREKWKYVVLFALISGAGLATKATFLPLVFSPLFILPTFKRKVSYLLGIVPAFVLFTIPAVPEYDRMFAWFSNMITHNGIYGTGEKGIIDWNKFFPAIRSILTFFSGFTALLTCAIPILATGYYFRKNENVKRDITFLAGLVTTSIVGILLVAKHYGGNHYLIPVLLLSGIFIYIELKTIELIWENKLLQKFLLPIVVITSAGFISWSYPSALTICNKQYKEASAEIDSANLWLEKNYRNYTRINYYIYSLNKYTGLKFGTDFAKGQMYLHLKKTFPNTYFYELSSNSFINWNLKTNLQDIIETNGNKIILVNGPSDSTQVAEIARNGFPLKKVYSVNSQNLYILDTLKYVEPPKEKLVQVGETIDFGVDGFSKEQKKFIGSNTESFGNISGLSTEYAHSGIYSIKLEKSNPFAVDYTLSNLKAGELYQIEVWRKSDTSSGYLVVSADDSKDYYQAQNEAIKYDKNGWEVLRIIVDVKQEIEGKKLKVYLWNPRRRTAYFDDLSIRKFAHVRNDNTVNIGTNQ